MRDQEDKANLALGAMDALHDLIASRDPLSSIQPEPLSYILQLVIDAARDAIPNGHPKHGRAANEGED
jgi:hypothetical protein